MYVLRRVDKFLGGHTNKHKTQHKKLCRIKYVVKFFTALFNSVEYHG